MQISVRILASDSMKCRVASSARVQAQSESMKPVYLLIVDKAWAKLYKSAPLSKALALVYHQALFGGGRTDDAAANDELARSLCRLLRADRLNGKFERLVMIAAPPMLAALRKQYDGDWNAVTTGRIDELPVRYTDDDIAAWLRRCSAPAAQQAAPQLAATGLRD